MQSLSYPPVKPAAFCKIIPRPTIPVYPPPEPLQYPDLPCKPRLASFHPQFTLSTHIIPATHLRTTPYEPLPPPLHPTLSKPERMAYYEELCKQLRQDSALSSGHPRVLWNCLNRFVRKGATGSGLTLFLAHANGFHKEAWEPTIKLLLNLPSGELVDEIWACDAVQHGDSALLNQESLGLTFDWADNGRDILNFLHYFIPSSANDSPLPTHLPRVSPQEIQHRKTHGLKHRTFMGIGHSYGGCSAAVAALEHPELFSSLMLIDPVILEPYATKELELSNPRVNVNVIGALNRRETWPSKEEALASFKKKPFFQRWDPEVLQTYVEYALYNTKDIQGRQAAMLKMPGLQEAIVFAATLAQYETYQRLPDLDERVELRWVVPGRPGEEMLGAEATQLRVWRRLKNSSNVKIPTSGHLIPQEAPGELSREIDEFLLRKYKNIRNTKCNL
ncbi:hypothetical protein Agabi119p4_8777 [Agaricus bisporus var. burnettii]|uniref:AB hydrolase-1 domain-containing protein n=1 Tax=Agaricus bisporus var. burnettii TaxID=192524 RepID=A0A8H7C608_AGABI|nr:hypothetical protein Agabi119p4_8777 [Agaricus bisporus var. burnettii]